MKPEMLDAALRGAWERLASDPAEAAERAMAILKAAPRQPAATVLLAGARRRQGAAAEAVALIAPLAKAERRNAVVQYEFGESLAALGKIDDAVVALRRAVAARPGMTAAWRTLAYVLFLSGDRAAADQACSRYVGAPIEDPLVAEAAAALKGGEASTAESSLRRHLAAIPHDVQALTMLAAAIMRRDAFAEAAALLDTVLDRHPSYVNARHGRAYAHFKLGQRAADVVSDVRRVVAAEPRNADAWALLGSALAALGDARGAAEALERSLAASPDNPTRIVLYGEQLKYVGRRDEAVAAFRRAIAIAPDHGEAWFRLGDLKTYRFTAEQERAMRALLAGDGLEPANRAFFRYALAQARADAGDHRQAFAESAAGAALQRSLLPYDPARSTSFTGRCKTLFTEGFFSIPARGGREDRDPIFVVGMPRAGSTLVEQILASHSEVEATAELPDLELIIRRLTASTRTGGYPSLLAGLSPSERSDLGKTYLDAARGRRRLGRPRFTDKKPENFQHIGFVHLILPNACIIDVRRNPMATGFAIFRQHFGEGRAYSYDLRDIGLFYRDYIELMAHWDRVLPGRVHRVVYENLVTNTEGEIRRMLDYCGLPFEPGCLNFHETKRVVMTPSAEQVRQPIFTKGIDEWRAYEPWLGPLKEALGPALDNWRGE